MRKLKAAFAIMILLGALQFALPAYADCIEGTETDPPKPQRLEDLENLKRETFVKEVNTEGLPFDIRNEAMREAALSYGARGGLAWRTYEIRQELEQHCAYLDKVFDFRLLLIAAPSGLLIEPPVISESVNAMLINPVGTEAAVADRVYDIAVDARIVSAARSWRNYLEREWGDVTPPPDLLRPATEEERVKWIEWVRIGWENGIEQADAIFQDDINHLTGDYQGMVRYRTLLSQGMVTPPYALQTDRGVTGGGKNLRVGDRAVQITGLPELVQGADKWQPASR